MKNSSKKIISIGTAGIMLISSLTGCSEKHYKYDSARSAVESIMCKELTNVDDVFDEECLYDIDEIMCYLYYSDLITALVSEFYDPEIIMNNKDAILKYHSIESEDMDLIKEYTLEEIDECLYVALSMYQDYQNCTISGDDYVNFLEEIKFFNYAASVNYFLSTCAPDTLENINKEFLQVYKDEDNKIDSNMKKLEESSKTLESISDVEDGVYYLDVYLGYNQNRNMKLQYNINILTDDVGIYVDKLNNKNKVISL